MITVKTPLPISVNEAYPTVFDRGKSTPRRKLSSRGGVVKTAIYYALKEQLGLTPWEPSCERPRLAIAVQYCFKNNQRRDLDNFYKLLQDAIALALGVDDVLVDEVHLTRGPICKEDPHCLVTIKEI